MGIESRSGTRGLGTELLMLFEEIGMTLPMRQIYFGEVTYEAGIGQRRMGADTRVRERAVGTFMDRHWRDAYEESK